MSKIARTSVAITSHNMCHEPNKNCGEQIKVKYTDVLKPMLKIINKVAKAEENKNIKYYLNRDYLPIIRQINANSRLRT